VLVLVLVLVPVPVLVPVLVLVLVLVLVNYHRFWCVFAVEPMWPGSTVSDR
jgi:hypothetical protein